MVDSTTIPVGSFALDIYEEGAKPLVCRGVLPKTLDRCAKPEMRYVRERISGRLPTTNCLVAACEPSTWRDRNCRPKLDLSGKVIN